MTSLSDFRVGPSLPVSDMERAREFYEGALGLRPAGPELQNDNNRSYECGDGTNLNIYVSPASAGASDATTLGWAVTGIEDVVAGLTENGVVFEQYGMPGVKTDERGIAHFDGDAKVAYFKDPDGNILSLAQAPSR